MTASTGTASSDAVGPEGLVWPAEWERHRATWLVWPRNADTWPGRLAEARAEFAVFVRELAAREPVELLVADSADEASALDAFAGAGVDRTRVTLHRVATDDAWIRDSGPIFLRRGAQRVLVDFGFDAWGGKYPPWDRDAAVPRAVERITGLTRLEAGFVLEGGSVDGDGAGTLLTTESCLLHPNRGARDREAMEERLAGWLGARAVIWLPGGIEGDDTDGHVDDVARFVAPGSVVATLPARSDHPDAEVLSANLRRLRDARDATGKPLAVATLPVPPRRIVAGETLPVSYANFYLANGCALVPSFGADEDARALAVLRELLPDRDVVGIPCVDLVRGLGALHCLSQQEPAGPL